MGGEAKQVEVDKAGGKRAAGAVAGGGRGAAAAAEQVGTRQVLARHVAVKVGSP